MDEPTLKQVIAMLESAEAKGVARGHAGLKEQEVMDYVLWLLCEDAPNVWERLCPKCERLITFRGAEEPEAPGDAETSVQQELF